MLTTLFAHAQSLVDYHCHYIPQSYRALVEKHGASLDEGFPLPQWSAEAHLHLMDEVGITTSILTLPAPHPFQYRFNNAIPYSPEATAAAVVTKDVPANAIVGGNPAKLIKMIPKI